VDERCAGFFALGLAKASGLPVAVACTSGTAAAELLPAAIEAYEARVPLLLLTADRPPELRENGAGQAIDQLKLFGGAAKWFFEVGVQDADTERLRWMRTLACRAFWTSLEGRPGVVHLNFPLREPLVTDEELPQDPTARSGGKPYVDRTPAPLDRSSSAAVIGELVWRSRRGVLIAGRYERETELGQAAAAFAATAGWPLLADPLSGARRGEAAIGHYDALLRDEAFAASLHPDLILRVGDLPVSKPLRTWLAGLEGVPQLSLDPDGAWQDPASVLSDVIVVEPAEVLRELSRVQGQPATAGATAVDEGWRESWRSADERAAEAILGALGDEELSEPRIASELGVLLPEEATLFVASSMPVRDIETFWPVRPDPPRVLCNRGANGIDGTVSAAFGVAAQAATGSSPTGPVSGATGPSPTGPVVLLIGDVALAHDLGGLLAAGRLGLKLTIVLIDNGGGGIFDFLPVSGATDALAPEALAPPGTEDIYTRHIATPTGLDFAKAAELYGLAHECADSIPAFRAALERALSPQADSTIVQARTDRTANVELHRRVWSAVSAALAPEPR